MKADQKEKMVCPCEQPPEVLAIVPAAGQGSRMGGTSNKPFIDLNGIPVIIRTLRALSACPCIREIIVVSKFDEIPAMKALLDQWPIECTAVVIPGGSTRQESVAAGLKAAAEIASEIDPSQKSDPIIAVHDGARCLVTPGVICRTLCHAATVSPCAAAVPVKDTIKQAAESSGQVVKTLDRSRLYAVQTPQAARLSDFVLAFEKAATTGFCATDDLSVLEASEIAVDLVDGEERNIKLTTPFDLLIAQAILSEER